MSQAGSPLPAGTLPTSSWLFQEIWATGLQLLAWLHSRGCAQRLPRSPRKGRSSSEGHMT